MSHSDVTLPVLYLIRQNPFRGKLCLGNHQKSKLSNLNPSSVICEVMNEDGRMARLNDLIKFSNKHKIKIASIADFQPWVTNGTLPPPANPLVVPQPCIRFGGDFSDIDNVGRTGRHLTSFIMFGQHSLITKNTPNVN